MAGGYLVFKFLHVTAAILWLGAIVAVSVVNARVVRGPDPGVAALLLDQTQFVGRAVIGPAMVLTLLSGFGMVSLLGSMPPWAGWGILVVLGSFLLGAVVLQPYGRQLAEVWTDGGVGSAREQALRRQLAGVGILNIVLLRSAVWAMVYKPGA